MQNLVSFLQSSLNYIGVMQNSLALQYLGANSFCSTPALFETHVTTENTKTLTLHKRQGNFFLDNSYESNIGYLNMRFIRLRGLRTT